MYTKRLIGEPGQTLQIAEDGKLMMNGSYSGLPVAYEKMVSQVGIKYIFLKKGDKVKLDKIIMIGKGVGKDDNGMMQQVQIGQDCKQQIDIKR